MSLLFSEPLEIMKPGMDMTLLNPVTKESEVI